MRAVIGSPNVSRTARMRNGASNGARCRVWASPCEVSIITPSDARTRFGSAQTENSSRRPSTERARSHDVTSQPPSAGTHDTGSAARRRASAGCGSASSSASVTAAPSGNAAARVTPP